MRSLFVSRASRLAAATVILSSCFTARLRAEQPSAPGLHDLVIYDPGTHELGLPSPQFGPPAHDELGNKDPGSGGLSVTIPPKVHVHRYYYSGDKEIQGPIITGGPVMVAAKHPKTGKMMYVDVTLPSGAPRIAYSKHAITYVYPKQRVAVEFKQGLLKGETAYVAYHSGRGWRRTASEAGEKFREHVEYTWASSPMVATLRDATKDAGRLVSGVGEATSQMTGQTFEKVKEGMHLIPGVTYLYSLHDQIPERKRDALIRAEEHRQEHARPVFVRTNQ